MTTADLDRELSQLTGRIRGVRSASIELSESFIDVVRRFAEIPGTVALMSGTDLDCAQYHFLGLYPWLSLRGTRNSLTIGRDGHCRELETDPFEALRQVLRHYQLSATDPKLPLCAGVMGYLAYDLKDCLEKLPRTSVDDRELPLLYLVAPSVLLVQDCRTSRTTIHTPIFEEDDPVVRRGIEAFYEALKGSFVPGDAQKRDRTQFKSAFSRAEYLSAVETVREYIASGDAYQVNMSQRFQAPFEGSPFELYASMYAANPAPFFAYIQAEDHQIVSTSPERFVSLQGRTVETRPIKGTRPRGNTLELDEALKAELATSPKDDAELSMIVDLLRNDIGKVCATDSVHVTEHKRVEAYENVYHLVSTVTGVLDEDKDAVDLLRATFPGGSITGCPKIRAMEIIDELEPVRRHIYTGSIGYLSFHGTMDLSVAIRTATFSNDEVVFSVGGGIVYDSDPSSEYEETLHKGQTLMNALAAPAPAGCDGDYAWHNGSFKPIGETSVSVESEAFLYGFGVFETIRVEQGRPLLLQEHLQRFESSFRYCFGSAPPDITWDAVIERLVARNRLSEKIAVVKILGGAGRPSHGPRKSELLVTAREYTPRPAVAAQRGLRVAVYPHGRHSHLADHKTMNYLFYKLAGTWAKTQGFDEALILNADDTVSETNTANLFSIVGKNAFCPASDHVLTGTMQGAVSKVLASLGYTVTTRKLTVADLSVADQLILTNSLMGAVSVSHLDATAIAVDEAFCQRINERVFRHD